jgi:hypothetical protein
MPGGVSRRRGAAIVIAVVGTAGALAVTWLAAGPGSIPAAIPGLVAPCVHITLEEADVKRLGARVGARRRSSFIAEAVRRALDGQERWELIESALGSIGAGGHEWDTDPAGWVHAQRRADARRTG